MLRVHRVQLGRQGHGRRRMYGEHGHGRRRMLGENGHGQLKGGGVISGVKKFIKKHPKVSAALGTAAAVGACSTFAAPACASAAAAAGVSAKALATAVGASIVKTGVAKVVAEANDEERKKKIAAEVAKKLGLGPEGEAMISSVVDGAVKDLTDKVVEKYQDAPTTEQNIDDAIKIGAQTITSFKSMQDQLARKFDELYKQGMWKLAEENIRTRQMLIDEFKRAGRITATANNPEPALPDVPPASAPPKPDAGPVREV